MFSVQKRGSTRPLRLTLFVVCERSRRSPSPGNFRDLRFLSLLQRSGVGTRNLGRQWQHGELRSRRVPFAEIQYGAYLVPHTRHLHGCLTRFVTIKADEGTAQSTVFTGGWLSMQLVRIILMIVLKLPGALHNTNGGSDWANLVRGERSGSGGARLRLRRGIFCEQPAGD